MKGNMIEDKTSISPLLSHLLEAKQAGLNYRTKFKTVWQEIEGQIRCVQPSSWSKKEDWQTKVFIPQQAKKSEIANSYLNKMVFGRGNNFDIKGVEEDDKPQAKDLVKLIANLMGDSFMFENKFVMHEGVDIGTGFLKFTVNADKNGFNYAWRTCYQVLIDPKGVHDIEKGRFVIDQFERDIAWLRAQAKKDKGLYNKANIEQIFADMENEGEKIKEGKNPAGGNAKNDLMVIKSIDGTADIEVPRQYKMIDLDEYWIDVVNDEGLYEKRVIAVINDKWIIRDDINEYGFYPFQWLRIKPRKYDSYGLGYMENTRGLQDLANSCVNLGFDSLKISSMDILLVDMSKVKDPSSIKYKPLAIWKMKDINGAKIQRQPVSAINDVLNGITLIDQIDQDASGINRNVQGSPELGGSKGEETLGEFERKLQLIDQRFLDVGRFIERDYYINVIRKHYRVITNPKLFTQKAVDDILGFDEEDEIEVVDGVAKVKGSKRVSKIDLSELRKKNWENNFRAVGITQFTEKLEVIAQLRQALNDALSHPELTLMTKIDELWKKLLSMSDIEDYEQLLRGKEEIRELMQQQNGALPDEQGVQGGPQGGQLNAAR